MRITFVHCTDRKYSDTQMFGVHFMPVWAYTLAAHLEKLPGLSLALFDDRFDDRDEAPEADLFLFSGINQDRDAILFLERQLRSRFPGSRFAIGGPICWSLNTAGKLAELSVFDHILIGDGEEAVVSLVNDLRSELTVPKVRQSARRFDLELALPMHRGLLGPTLSRYYGAVLEVSRGCPFLCEFCDIRILPDNNRSHVKPPALIVDELEYLAVRGIRQVLFACDNFIGNPAWAEEVCDRIIAWRESTGHRLSIYTWLTINLSRTPRLLKKLRAAGFDMFFIGIESFNQSSLLETAKLQNTTLDLIAAIREIQSYGFIVVAGLIFGFDTDPENIVSLTLSGIVSSGLISGDPSLLTALPGTPLYHRMKLSGRLRNGKLGLGGFKYQTNIVYLKPADQIKRDFKDFVREFNRGGYQFRRLTAYYSCIDSINYLAPLTAGYADLRKLMRMSVREGKLVRLLAERMLRLFRHPLRMTYILRAVALTLIKSRKTKPLWPYFKFWLFNWSNSIVKYGNLSFRDFDIDSVGLDFEIRNVLPDAYESSGDEAIPENKTRSQRKATSLALRDFLSKKSAAAATKPASSR